MGKISDIVARIKNIKHKEIIAGAVLMVAVLTAYFCFASCSSSDKTDSGVTNIKGGDYCATMQLQLEKIVSEISGVGDASVVINWDRSVTTSFTGGAAENPKATGVLVVCDGGNDTKVKLDVIYAVSTLLDLSIEKIIVYPKK